MSYTENVKGFASATVITTGVLVGLGFMFYGMYKFYDEYIHEDLDPVCSSKHQDEADTDTKTETSDVSENTNEESLTTGDLNTSKNSKTQATEINNNIESEHEPEASRRTGGYTPGQRLNPEDLKPSVFYDENQSVDTVFRDLIMESSADNVDQPRTKITDPPRNSTVSFGGKRNHE